VMDHRERVMAAIRHEPSDRIPVDAICIENADAVGGLLGIPAEAVHECGPNHHIKPDVPAANVVALFDAARACGGAALTKKEAK